MYGESKIEVAIGLEIGTLHVITVLALQLHQICSQIFLVRINVSIEQMKILEKRIYD